MVVRSLMSISLMLSVAGAASAGPSSGDKGDKAPRVAVGQTIDNIHFKDIRYLRRSLDDLKDKKAYVVVFTTTTCPLVERYMPKLKRLDEKYRGQGVQFIGVNVGPSETVQDAAEQALEFGISFHVGKDVNNECVDKLGVERTPEVVVLDKGRRIVYRGRIDDQQRVGGARPNATSEDLQNAIEDVLAGRPVKTQSTTVDGCLITRSKPPRFDHAVTYHEHIAPLMQKHCQECHHPGGESIPFALMTYEEVKSVGEMVAETVDDQRMPPWYASRHQHFVNERRLAPKERDLIVAWAQGGMLEGDKSKSPSAKSYANHKWTIGTPDLVITAPQVHSLPADGYVDYKYVVMPYVFLQDTWIAAAEILPDNPSVVHHCNMAYASIGKSYNDGNFITGRVPGGTALICDEGTAFKIPKNSVLGLQIHYTVTGKPEKNQMSVGIRFPKKPIQKELKHLIVTTNKFAIPPGDSAHPVASTRTLSADAFGLGMFSHMHLRGKDMTFIAKYPDGKTETFLTIPNYSYEWQQNYRWQPNTKKFPKGTNIEVVAHFDNSAFNPYNPDPKATVKHGPQTFHEMMFGFFFYTEEGENLNLHVNPKNGQVISERPGGVAKGN